MYMLVVKLLLKDLSSWSTDERRETRNTKSYSFDKQLRIAMDLIIAISNRLNTNSV